MSQISLAQPQLPPLVGPILRLLTNRFAPIGILILLVLVAEIVGIAVFGPVVLAMTGLALVPVIFTLLIIVAGH